MSVVNDYLIKPKQNDISYKKPFRIASFERNVLNLNKGIWTMHIQKGQEIQTENLFDFEGIPGVLITNSIHDFGFKYVSLYNNFLY